MTLFQARGVQSSQGPLAVLSYGVGLPHLLLEGSLWFKDVLIWEAQFPRNLELFTSLRKSNLCVAHVICISFEFTEACKLEKNLQNLFQTRLISTYT